MYKDDHIKIEVTPCQSYEHRSAAGNRRRSSIRSLSGRLEYLTTRRDEQGIDNPYISAEISALEWALILLKDEYEAFKDANKNVTEVSSKPPVPSADSDLVSLANDSSDS